MREVLCSTPSIICLFGEHLDYLGLAVIALSIDLRFSARVRPRRDHMVFLKIRDTRLGQLNVENTQGIYQKLHFDLSRPIVYERKRDYIKSVFQVLLREGYDISCGFDIQMDSTIPIGKGMCSSSTMVVVLIKALLEAVEHVDAQNPERIAYLGYLAEVVEFHEPGGMMDHYASALGSLVYIYFANGAKAVPIRSEIDVYKRQAVKMMIYACGHEFTAEDRGSYPAGYMAVGQEIGLLKGITAVSYTHLDVYKRQVFGDLPVFRRVEAC